jgi:molybdopterin synthase catalytic subunit
MNGQANDVTVRIQAEDFDSGREIAALRRDKPGIGAIAGFIGVVREVNDGDKVVAMTLGIIRA